MLGPRGDTAERDPGDVSCGLSVDRSPSLLRSAMIFFAIGWENVRSGNVISTESLMGLTFPPSSSASRRTDTGLPARV